MKFKFDFKKIISYFNLDGERGLAINSVRDWKVLLACALLVLVAVSAFDISILLRVKSELDVAVQTPSVSKEIKTDEQGLNQVLKNMEERAANFASISGLVVGSTPTASSTIKK
jgi:hypothetical protein